MNRYKTPCKVTPNDMYTINDEGLIVFNDCYKYLYAAFYHSSWIPYSLGPPGRSQCRLITTIHRLSGEGFLFENGSPFVRVGVEETSRIVVHNQGPTTNLRFYRMSISTGRMIPILDSEYDIIDFELEEGEVYVTDVVGVDSICIRSSKHCDITVSVETLSCDAASEEVALHNMGEFKTVEVGYRRLLLDAVYPTFAPIEYLVQNSLSILSVNPPLAGLITASSFGLASTHSCPMVYHQGELWSDFPEDGNAGKYSLPVKTTQTIISKLAITTLYSSDRKVSGTVAIRTKIRPDGYSDCNASENYIKISDISKINLSDIRLLYPYSNIVITVSTDTGDDVDIIQSSCTVTLLS